MTRELLVKFNLTWYSSGRISKLGPGLNTKGFMKDEEDEQGHK